MRTILALALSAQFALLLSGATANATDFAAVPAAQPSNDIELPDFYGRDEWASHYRTRITNAVKAGANYNGHFTVAEIGCGTSCRFVFIADNSTGKVSDFPLGGEENYQLVLDYRVSSGLIKAAWLDTSVEPAVCVNHEYIWSGGLQELASIRTAATGDYCALD